MAEPTETPAKSVTCELPIFAAVIASVARERGVSLPVAITIQSIHGEPDKHFAILGAFGRPVAVACASHSEAAALVTKQAA